MSAIDITILNRIAELAMTIPGIAVITLLSSFSISHLIIKIADK